MNNIAQQMSYVYVVTARLAVHCLSCSSCSSSSSIGGMTVQTDNALACNKPSWRAWTQPVYVSRHVALTEPKVASITEAGKRMGEAGAVLWPGGLGTLLAPSARLLFTPDLTTAVRISMYYCLPQTQLNRRMILLCRCCNFQRQESYNPQQIKSLHWFKVQECIKYRVISSTYKLLRSSSPRNLNDLVTVQPSQSTRSSALVTLLQPSIDSRLKITNRSFPYAAPHLWNKLPPTLRVPYQFDRSSLPTQLFSIVIPWS